MRVQLGKVEAGELAVNGADLDGTLIDRAVRAGRIRGPEPTVQAPVSSWSAWTPEPGSTGAVSKEIASHVGSGYRVDSGGAPLVDVIAGPRRRRGRAARSSSRRSPSGVGSARPRGS